MLVLLFAARVLCGEVVAAQPAPQAPLTLDPIPVFRAPVRIAHEDLDLRLTTGGAFAARAGGRIAILVMVGSGTLTVAPPLPSEQRQLHLFAGAAHLQVAFEAALLESAPEEVAALVRESSPWQGAPPGALAARAERMLAEHWKRVSSAGAPTAAPGSHGYTALPPGDLVIVVDTGRGRRLAYTRAGERPEDVMLVDVTSGRRVLAYPSAARRAAWGWQFGDEYGRPDEVTRYDIEVSVDPERGGLAGRTRLILRALDILSLLSLRLDRGLVVSRVVSAGRSEHAFVQQRERDTLLVQVAPPLVAGETLELDVHYAGVAAPQPLFPARRRDREDLLAAASKAAGLVLYSNRVYWFPQSPVRNHTTGVIRATVPAGFVAYGTGVPDAESPVVRPDGSVTFVLRAAVPVRYYALVVGRFVTVADLVAEGLHPVRIQVAALPSLVERARRLAPQVAHIVRFLATWVGEAPYPRLTVVVVETPVPAAHSPAFLTVLGEPPGWDARLVEDDPAYFREDPAFFLAHEIAHQWWGHAVGWRNYREQWLSEGFAQYFAALYLREAGGERAFARVLAWLRRWARSVRGQGPIALGVRAGELGDDPRRFTAIVYCRAAYVLHMLRALAGEDLFRAAVQRYAARWKFRRAGTDDLRAVFEEVTGLALERFFEQWIRQDGEPEVQWWIVTPVRPGEPLTIVVEQVGEPFDVPLDVRIEDRNRGVSTSVVRLSASRQVFTWPVEGPVRRVAVNEAGTGLAGVRRRAPPR